MSKHHQLTLIQPIGVRVRSHLGAILRLHRVCGTQLATRCDILSRDRLSMSLRHLSGKRSPRLVKIGGIQMRLLSNEDATVRVVISGSTG